MADKDTNTYKTIAWEADELLPAGAPWEDVIALAEPLIKDVEQYGGYEKCIWQIKLAEDTMALFYPETAGIHGSGKWSFQRWY